MKTWTGGAIGIRSSSGDESGGVEIASAKGESLSGDVTLGSGEAVRGTGSVSISSGEVLTGRAGDISINAGQSALTRTDGSAVTVTSSETLLQVRPGTADRGITLETLASNRQQPLS